MKKKKKMEKKVVMVMHAFLAGEARVECLARPHASVDGMPETVVLGQPGKGLVRRSQCPHVRLVPPAPS